MSSDVWLQISELHSTDLFLFFFLFSLQWPIHVINLADKSKGLCSLPHRHHSFFLSFDQ